MNVSYYILVSKYEGDNHHYDDVFPHMVNKNSISIGFAGEYNLKLLYGKPESEIVAKLQSLGEPSKSYLAHKLFLNLKPGDMVAVKGSGSPVRSRPRLVIVGYAVVVEREGHVYQHDPQAFPKGLGHLINVDFIEVDTHREFPLGYGWTIHRLSDPSHIKQIFGYYANYPAVHLPQSQGTTKKNISTQIRRINSSYVVDAAHNRLQQAYYDYLVVKHGAHNVKMEVGYVDIILTEPQRRTFFEVKPYQSAMQCLRDGLGQILEYSWTRRFNKKENLRLVVVANARPNHDEQAYIDFLKSNLNFDFDYEYFKSK